ncbi:MAG TPA: diguanylate cyclase [Solirubrobacterales bacterium]|nr:diguanylate cyclase [Solirubrobacterales bacterium]
MSEGSRDRLRAIIQTQTEIAASDLELDAVMELIARRAQDLTRGSGGVIEIADGEVVTYRATSGDVTAGNARSMICVPLVHREETFGVLKVFAPRVSNFDEGDVEALELLGELIAAHMSHASFFDAEVHGGRHDVLTGLLNRRAYEERLPVEIARASRYAWPLSLCLLDLDGFKQLNDKLGHPAGDRALQQVAALLDESRLADDSFRIGGDEFALLMPQTCAEDAELAAARLGQEISRIGMSDGSLGASFGVAEGAEDPAVLQAMAEERLLAAKDRLYRRRR